MEKVLFITNRVFIDDSKMEGGVRLCTYDFIKLLQCKYEVINFPLDYSKKISFRLKAKLGMDVLEDYDKAAYATELFKAIREQGITKVFINLSSTSAVAEVIKNEFKDTVTIALCSHGIEAGDLLHHTVRFKHFLPWIKQKTSAWKLGKTLQKELELRLNSFDIVLTVSEIEQSIEHWLGAKEVFFVPRVFEPDYIQWNPVLGRVGFIADVSHYPNYYGLLQLCKAIKRSSYAEKINIRVVGKNCTNLDLLKNEFPFVTALGYMDNAELITEAGTWMYYLNLVFYYSKGVSTKLAKGMNWGLPVLSTVAGNRGHVFYNGNVVTCDTAEDMVSIILSRLENKDLLDGDMKNVKLAVESFCDYNKVMDNLYPIMEKINLHF